MPGTVLGTLDTALEKPGKIPSCGNIWANSILNKGNKSRALNKPNAFGLFQGLKGVTMARTLSARESKDEAREETRCQTI